MKGNKMEQDYTLPRNAVLDLLFALTSCVLKMDEDQDIKANGCYDLLTNILNTNPEPEVMRYQLMELARIEGHNE